MSELIEQSGECPNGCGEFRVVKISDVAAMDTDFDITIIFCPECRYVEDVWAE